MIEQVAAKAGWNARWRDCGNIRDWFHSNTQDNAYAVQSVRGDHLTAEGLCHLHLRLLHAGYVVRSWSIDDRRSYWIEDRSAAIIGTPHPTIEEAVMRGFLEVSDG